ncbi:Phosphoserine phosphatase RsbU [Geobacillus sp. BCO2]|nr:Phosphoserine phosphatase RsbU [Geobacillus sp. BCO2]
MSGDFYHFAVHQTSVSAGIADVSGKGIPAAMLMTLMKFILDRTVHYGTQPHVYLDLLNRFVYDYTEPSMFVTMFVGNYNEKTHTFSYACAGHEPALWYRAKTKQCVPLHAKGCALGLFPQFSFETKSVVLEPGDFVLLYTDGVTEKRGEEADDDFSVLARWLYASIWTSQQRKSSAICTSKLRRTTNTNKKTTRRYCCSAAADAALVSRWRRFWLLRRGGSGQLPFQLFDRPLLNAADRHLRDAEPFSERPLRLAAPEDGVDDDLFLLAQFADRLL